MTPTWHPCAEGEKLYQAYCAEAEKVVALGYYITDPNQPILKTWHEWREHVEHCESCRIERET